jgi:hypothetical protein
MRMLNKSSGSQTSRTPIASTGKIAGLTTVSSFINEGTSQGMLEIHCSAAVKAIFRIGPIPPVKVRTHRVMGSRIKRLRLPNKAAIRITVSKTNFIFRKLSGIEIPTFFDNFRKLIISRVVPTGQIQPHQDRPKTKVNPRTTRLRIRLT